jgi:hypothetical protein
VFQEYAESLAGRLVADFELHGKTIIEIGCGDGDFLRLLCRKGDNRGLGFDPSHIPGHVGADDGSIEIVRELYGEKYAGIPCDFVCCRHTLEHVQKPADLLVPLRRSIGSRLDTPVFFEVPNGAYTLDNLFIWDIIYEHTSYFTSCSLKHAFEAAGFRVERLYNSFDGQYLCIEAFASHGDDGARSSQCAEAIAASAPAENTGDLLATNSRGIEALRSQVDRFVKGYTTYVNGWHWCLSGLETAGKRVVVWGGGSKGITFLNLFRAVQAVGHVVDLNPQKHGMYIAGTGQEIVSPRWLVDHGVDTVIVVNPVYRAEIEGLTKELGLEPEFLFL